MSVFRPRKAAAIDYAHVKYLHDECIEQLELMKISLESAQLSNDEIRDQLDYMAQNHWQFYLDTLHLLSMHDNDLKDSLLKVGLNARNTESNQEKEYQVKRVLLLALTTSLIKRHRRMEYVFSNQNNPAKDFLSLAAPIERDYLVTTITIIHNLI
ncbi:hypothetical protein [Anaerosinus gibii]|uniref:Uncharacterized protein n=1 Tax=Selenobaculum gibii TaxID=3054208 RepID=A0A9Y2EUD8_9FIRM|nr:hypothetical protein [Selenobaculum gbiensis]WIW71630.1 hypothetical protein P3F81_04825 [Selenobaculum gbiensis]